jgi:carbon monoxide dehydrogenase subunit G
VARYHATIDTRQSPEELFAYLSDLSTAAQWDPGVVEAERLGDGPIGAGTCFRLVAEFMGRRSPLTYRIVGYTPPHAVTFLGENRTVTSLDRITFTPTGELTRITYDADLQLKGLFRIIDPLLQRAFNRTGDRALHGLRGVLAGWSPEDWGAAA